MEIQKFRLVPEGDGFTLLLYLDSNGIQFAAELGTYAQPKQDIRQEIKRIIKRNFKNLKVNTVRIMVGTILVTSFPIGTFTAEAEAASSGTKTTLTGWRLGLSSRCLCVGRLALVGSPMVYLLPFNSNTQSSAIFTQLISFLTQLSLIYTQLPPKCTHIISKTTQ